MEETLEVFPSNLSVLWLTELYPGSLLLAQGVHVSGAGQAFGPPLCSRWVRGRVEP